MAADQSGPWSRWDAPGFQYVSTNTQPTIQRVFDVGAINSGFGNGAPVGQGVFYNDGQPFLRTTLLEQRVNSLDPSFYDCVYGVANSAQTVIEQCYKDIGCCSTTCCDNWSWRDKYGWAVALIVIFCILVLIAMLISLGCWLFNRAADKHQKKELLEGAGLSPAPSQLSLAPSPVANGYNPYTASPGAYRY